MVGRRYRHGEVFSFGSLGNPFSGRVTPSESLILYLPRDLFAQSTAFARRHEQHGSVGQRRHAADRLPQRGRGTAVPASPNRICPRIANATRDMILACYRPCHRRRGHIRRHSQSCAHRAGAPLRPAQFWPSRTCPPSDMARALGVSRTRLYQLFRAQRGRAALHPEAQAAGRPCGAGRPCRYATDHRHSGSRRVHVGRQFSVGPSARNSATARAKPRNAILSEPPDPARGHRHGGRKAPPSTAGSRRSAVGAPSQRADVQPIFWAVNGLTVRHCMLLGELPKPRASAPADEISYSKTLTPVTSVGLTRVTCQTTLAPVVAPSPESRSSTSTPRQECPPARVQLTRPAASAINVLGLNHPFHLIWRVSPLIWPGTVWPVSEKSGHADASVAPRCYAPHSVLGNERRLELTGQSPGPPK